SYAPTSPPSAARGDEVSVTRFSPFYLGSSCPAGYNAGRSDPERLGNARPPDEIVARCPAWERAISRHRTSQVRDDDFRPLSAAVLRGRERRGRQGPPARLHHAKDAGREQ